MNDTSARVPAELTGVCEQAVAEVMADTDGVILAMVATVDGFPVAACSAPGWDIPANRLAAMASSGHALGDSVAGELTKTSCENVIIDADRLSIVFLAVPEFRDPRLLLGLAARKTTSLGTVIYSAGACARRIAREANALA